MKKILITLITCLISCYSVSEIPQLPFGKNTQIDSNGESIQIDYSAISKFIDSLDEAVLKSNFWEVVYFINLGDLDLTRATMIYISENIPVDFLHDRVGIFLLAKAVSQNDLFWMLLKDLDENKALLLLNYYKENPDFYENIEGFDYMYSEFTKS